MTTADHPSRAGIKSIEVAYRLLEALAEARRPLALKDLALAASMSPSKAHRYLVSLARVELVQQNLHTRLYELGSSAMRISLAAVAQSDCLERAIKLQGQLRDAVQETVILTVWGGQGPTILHIEESAQAVHMTMKVGAVLSIPNTAAGRIFAAYLPDAIVRPAVSAQFRHQSPTKGQDEVWQQLSERACKVRETGMAVCIDEYVEGVTTLAAPLQDPDGKLVASVGVMGRTGVIDHSANGRIAMELKMAARKFRLGH